jgi:hypothetical protein
VQYKNFLKKKFDTHAEFQYLLVFLLTSSDPGLDFQNIIRIATQNKEALMKMTESLRGMSGGIEAILDSEVRVSPFSFVQCGQATQSSRAYTGQSGQSSRLREWVCRTAIS